MEPAAADGSWYASLLSLGVLDWQLLYRLRRQRGSVAAAPAQSSDFSGIGSNYRNKKKII